MCFIQESPQVLFEKVDVQHPVSFLPMGRYSMLRRGLQKMVSTKDAPEKLC